MKQHFPDYTYRIGGDEFVVLCDNVDEDVFNNKVLHFIDKVEADDNINIAFGYHWYNDSVGIIDKIKFVDNLMYINKNKYYQSNNIVDRRKS